MKLPCDITHKRKDKIISELGGSSYGFNQIIYMINRVITKF